MRTTIRHPGIQNEEQLKAELIKTSKANPRKYVTFHASLGNTRFYLLDRKPQSTNVHGAEESYRLWGGFLKNGKVVKPSPSWIKRFEFVPYLG